MPQHPDPQSPRTPPPHQDRPPRQTTPNGKRRAAAVSNALFGVATRPGPLPNRLATLAEATAGPLASRLAASHQGTLTLARHRGLTIAEALLNLAPTMTDPQ